MFRPITENPVDVRIYSDGACSGNPGKGGWGMVVLLPEGIYEECGGKAETTNNEMELTAFLNALEYCRENKIKTVRIYTDSAYVANGIIKGWVNKWMSNGWKTVQGKDVKNRNLWEKIYKYMNFKPMTFEIKKVKGHAGDALNEKADELARRGIEKIS